uniref:Retrotransposon gag domain-containing protein n=1 Tax=Brassica oleracea TaxID=3712 RepID=A0A3P6FEM3_BRAOL|nr:unnamed protein product [Brassica oleracea]
MELVFDGQNYSERKKVKLATTEYCGDAIQWWDQLVTTRIRTGETQVASWFELKHFMKKHFDSGNYSNRQPRQAKEETRPCHDHNHPRKSQSNKQRKPDPRPLSRVSEQLISRKESAIQKLKTEPSKVSTEPETENEFSLFSPQSELVLNKTCDQLTCFEPVHPSSLVSGSQVLEENSAEEAQTSSPPDEVLEKPNNIEAKTDAKSFSLNSQEHFYGRLVVCPRGFLLIGVVRKKVCEPKNPP